MRSASAWRSGRRDILGLVIREAAALVAIGLAAGALLSLGVTTTAQTLLYGLQPSDPATLVLAMAALTIVALSSNLLPAHRAATIDPLQAPHEE